MSTSLTGRIPDSGHYRYKLAWFAALRDQLSAEAAEAIVCGDITSRPPARTSSTYRGGMFHQDLGMRIDLVLARALAAVRVRAAWIDRQAPKGSGPSDRAPVIVDLDEAPDGDIGPVVPLPSAPAARGPARQAPPVPERRRTAGRRSAQPRVR